MRRILPAASPRLVACRDVRPEGLQRVTGGVNLQQTRVFTEIDLEPAAVEQLMPEIAKWETSSLPLHASCWKHAYT